MATKSILKHIMIKRPENARRFVSALENAKGKGSRSVSASRIVKDATRDEIRMMFNAEK